MRYSSRGQKQHGRLICKRLWPKTGIICKVLDGAAMQEAALKQVRTSIFIILVLKYTCSMEFFFNFQSYLAIGVSEAPNAFSWIVNHPEFVHLHIPCDFSTTHLMYVLCDCSIDIHD